MTPSSHIRRYLALIFYDWLCTWNPELRWIWNARGRGTIASILYIVARCSQIIQVIVTVSTINSVSDQVRGIPGPYTHGNNFQTPIQRCELLSRFLFLLRANASVSCEVLGWIYGIHAIISKLCVASLFEASYTIASEH